MHADSFRIWLKNKGCIFERYDRKNGGESGFLIRLREKRTYLPPGAYLNIDGGEVDRVLKDLGLEQLPGHDGDQTV